MSQPKVYTTKVYSSITTAIIATDVRSKVTTNLTMMFCYRWTTVHDLCDPPFPNAPDAAFSIALPDIHLGPHARAVATASHDRRIHPCCQECHNRSWCSE